MILQVRESHSDEKASFAVFAPGMHYDRSPQKALIKRLLWTAAIGTWLVGTAWGILLFGGYSFQPGETGLSGYTWPADSALRWERDGRFTLVIALHPECPCSRTSLDVIDSLLAQRSQAFRVVAIVVAPQNVAEESDLWNRACRMPGVTVVVDATGIEARRFAFRTSGETRLFAPNGSMRFRGGVTMARGHAGPSPGQTAILAAIDSGARADVAFAPVFGCGLFNDPADSNDA